MEWLQQNVKDFVKHFKVVSFDNLGIKQLNPKSFLTQKQWDEFYRGDDGSHTLYIDLVSETFAKNSIQTKEYHMPITNDIKDMLKKVQYAHDYTTSKLKLTDNLPYIPEPGDEFIIPNILVTEENK